MRPFALPVLAVALALAAACASAKPPPTQNDDFAWYEEMLTGAENLRAGVGRLTLRARAGDTHEALAEQLRLNAQQCQAFAEDLLSRLDELEAKHPGDRRLEDASAKGTAAAKKLRESAEEAEAATILIGTAKAEELFAAGAVAGSKTASSPRPEPAPERAAPEPGPAPSPEPEPDLVSDAAEQAALALLPKLVPHKARPLVVTPVVTEIGDVMPRLALAFGNKGSQADIYGRAFSRRLAAALAQRGLKVTFSSDVGAQLAAAPAKPQKDLSQVRILVYGALASLPGRFVAWDLRAVDLNHDGILGETQGVYRPR